MKSKLLLYSSLIGLSIQAHAIDLEVYAGRDNKPVNVTAKGNGFDKKYFEENNYGLKAYIDPLPHNIQLGLGLNSSSTNSLFDFNDISPETVNNTQLNYLRMSAISVSAQILWKPIPYLGVNLSSGLMNRTHFVGVTEKSGNKESNVYGLGILTRFEISGEYPINDWTIALAIGVESENVKGPLISDGGSELSIVDHAPMQYGASLGVRYTIPWPNSKPKNNQGLDERYEAPEAESQPWDDEEAVNPESDSKAETPQAVETGPTEAEKKAADLKAQKEQAARDAEVAAWEEEDRLEREAKEAQRIAREKAWEESQKKEAVKVQNSELSEDNDYQWD